MRAFFAYFRLLEGYRDGWIDVGVIVRWVYVVGGH